MCTKINEVSLNSNEKQKSFLMTHSRDGPMRQAGKLGPRNINHAYKGHKLATFGVIIAYSTM